MTRNAERHYEPRCLARHDATMAAGSTGRDAQVSCQEGHPLFSPTNGESGELGHKEPVAASLWTTRTRRRFLLSRPKCNGRRCHQHPKPPQRRGKETTHGRRKMFLLQTARAHVKKLPKETQSTQCPEPPDLTKRTPSPLCPHRMSRRRRNHRRHTRTEGRS
jgi:hypothetical protein